jgi:protein-S-isoprenylcysteine O-methyltransferase Ste14
MIGARGLRVSARYAVSMSPSAPPVTARDPLLWKAWASGILKVVLGGVLIYVIAGRTDYWQGWVLVGVGVLSYGAALAVLWDRRDLIRERSRPGPGVKGWDRAMVALLRVLMSAVLVVGYLDAGRYGWSPTLPWWSYLLSYAAMALATVPALWAMKVNAFFSSHVRIQHDRGHRVCREGPYRWVRHPGYSGIVLYGPLLPLALGSLWALIPGLLCIPLLVWRTSREDATLQRELPGYADYAQQVRYRLLPGVW